MIDQNTELPLSKEINALIELVRNNQGTGLINDGLILEKAKSFQDLIAKNQDLKMLFQNIANLARQGKVDPSEYLLFCEVVTSHGLEINAKIKQIDGWFKELQRFLQIPAEGTKN